MRFSDKFLWVLGIFIVVSFVSYTAFNIANSEMNDLIDESLGIERRGLFTGFAIINDSDEKVIVTEEMALEAIEEANRSISIMKEHGFNTLFVEDLLLEARRVFERAKFADILRSNSPNLEEKARARAALRLVNWEEIYYEGVIELTDQIKERETKSLLLEDMIKVRNEDFESLKEPSELTVNLVEEVDIAFREERYQDTQELLDRLRDSIESDREGSSFISGVRDGAKNFVQRYWILLLVLIVLIIGGTYYGSKKVSIKILKKKIAKMKQERNVLISLIKKTQIDRYKKNAISGLVYNIRVKKYKDRLHKIDQELPVLRNRLAIIQKRRTKGGKESV